MEFQVKVLLISFAITVLISFVVIPILRKLKVGQVERDDAIFINRFWSYRIYR